MFQLLFGVLILAVGGILIWFGGQQANEGWKKIHYKDTNKESVDIQFISTLFFNKSDKKVLDDHDSRRHVYGGEQFDGKLQHYIRNCIEHDENLSQGDFNKVGDKVKDLYFHLVFIKLLSRLFWMYADWWDIRVKSVRRGDSMETIVSAIKPDPDSNLLEWKDFLGALNKKDDFSKLLSSFSENHWIKKMNVPPQTKVDFITSKYRRTLVLTNPFVRVSIAISKSSGSVGLGDYKWLLGYDNKKSEDFWSEHFEVNCKAEYEKFRSGHPEMKRYKRWVETMFAEIQYQLDDEKRLKRARDYRDLISQ